MFYLKLKKENVTIVCLLVSWFGIFRECTFCLVSYHLSNDREHVLSKLRSTPRSLFLYLKTLFEVYLSGTLDFSCVKVENVIDGSWGRQNNWENSLNSYLARVQEFPKFICNKPIEVTDDIVELYLEVSFTAYVMRHIHSLFQVKQSGYLFFLFIALLLL